MKKRQIDSLSETELRLELLDVLSSGAPLRLDDILRRLGISRRAKRFVVDTLHDMEKDGSLVTLHSGAWAAADKLKSVCGVLSVQRSGAAFVRPDAPAGKKAEDVYIAPEDMGGAWDGDYVNVSLYPRSRKGYTHANLHIEGCVIAVLERAHREVTARVLRQPVTVPDGQPLTVMCRPADPRLELELLVDLSALPEIPAEGELLRVAVGERLDDAEEMAGAVARRRPKGRGDRRVKRALLPLWSGRALASLGREDDARTQEDLTKLNHEIPTSFPDIVLAEAEAVAAEAWNEEGLENLRDMPLVTIDGEDARDFDDAVYVAREGKGWLLVVAIADVSHYVRPRSHLDKEALERGNSYYFPTSVEPMLPEVLCNGLCSLRPGEDRRAMCVKVSFDAHGMPLSSRFSHAVVRSHARLSYGQVEAMMKGTAYDASKAFRRSDLATENMPLSTPTEEVKAMIRDAAELAGVLIRRRHNAGGLDFDLPEAEFQVKDNRVTGIGNRERLFSHRLIEAFMVAANEAVARFLLEKGAPAPYRVHPSPSPEKLEDLARGLSATNLDLPLPAPAAVTKNGDWIPAMLAAARDMEDLRPEQNFLINRLCLRSMMQARYDPEQDIHFGLASDCYCHFTSPIRRYADLAAHRALKYALRLETGGPIPTGFKLLAVTDHCNERERAAQDAEREITRRFGCLLLRDREGEVFEGVINGVMNFGLFIELEGLPLEGMVRVETLGQDYFEYDSERQELRGVASNVAYRLGQSVKVRLEEVNVGRLEINLTLLDTEDMPQRKGGRRLRPQHFAHDAPRRVHDGKERRRDRDAGGKEGKRSERRASRTHDREDRRSSAYRDSRKEGRQDGGREDHSFRHRDGEGSRRYSRDDRAQSPHDRHRHNSDHQDRRGKKTTDRQRSGHRHSRG